MSRRRKCALIFSLAATLLMVFRASGQESTSIGRTADYAGFWLDELIDMDSEYGAATYDEKTVYTPAGMTVITADEIRAFGWRTLADILASVRGFHVTYDRSYDYIGARGFGRPGDYNTRVLLLVDGHPVNDIIYGSAYVGAETLIDLSIVRRIKIMHGPNAASYGDGAFFAVINLITRNGDETDGGEVSLEYGGLGRRGATAAWGTDIGSASSLLLSAGGTRCDGGDIYWPEFDDPLTDNGVAVGGDSEESSHFYGKLHSRGLQATAAWARRDKGIPTGEWGMNFNDTGAQGRDTRLALDLSGLRMLSKSTVLRARISYDDCEYIGDYPFDDDGPAGPQERYLWRYISRGKWWSGELQCSGIIPGGHRILAGASFRQSTTGRQTGIVVDSNDTFLDINNEIDNAGLYVQDAWSLSDGTTLYLGLREDSYRSFGGNLTTRAAVVTTLDPRTRATLAYGGAFRAPNAYELYYFDRGISKDNPGLAPELVDTWEAICERDLAVGIRASLTVFDNRISRLIEQIADPVDSLLVFTNRGEVRARGAELELDGRMLAGVNGRFSISLQRAEDAATGSILSNAPARLVKLNLSTPRFQRALAGALEMQHVSRRPTLAGNFAQSYTVVNLDVTWWPPVPGCQVDLGVDNALDQRYGDPGAEHQVQDVLPREGRLLTARLVWHW